MAHGRTIDSYALQCVLAVVRRAPAIVGMIWALPASAQPLDHSSIFPFKRRLGTDTFDLLSAGVSADFSRQCKNVGEQELV